MEINENETDFPVALQRLVHLDLKGAPPRLSYYEKIFPLLRKWGATGLLVEYEDMFPYTGEISDLRAEHAYSELEVQQLQELAKINALEVIPLVQTFGHFEFVLKHDKFRRLREIPDYPMTLCPLNEDSMSLVKLMIDQVVRLHDGIKRFHIGADEVFHLGVCPACAEYLTEKGATPTKLFLGYIRQILLHLRQNYPAIQPVMWDDMFRDVDLDTILDSGISDLVEPMVWYYHTTFCFKPEMWDRYSRAFSGIWAASAFRGATGPCTFATDVGYHLENQVRWLEETQKIPERDAKLRGYALTGWQRYDHYSTLCELLPVGLPSMAMCLQTLTNGCFDVDIHKVASADLGFTELIPLSPFKSIGFFPPCLFPGSIVFVGIQMLLSLKNDFGNLMRSDRLNGWMTDYHVEHNFTNPAHLQSFLIDSQKLLGNYRELIGELEPAMLEIFYPDAVDEWTSVNIKPNIKTLEEIVEKARKQMALGGRPKSRAS